jgi:hypothetical protein
MGASRQKLLEEAVRQGLPMHEAKRTPTYALKDKLGGYNHTSTAAESPASAIVPPTHVSTQDDAETLVDMSHFTNYDNPADQKYHRFVFLRQAKEQLAEAIRINTELKISNKGSLDADDLYVLDREIAVAQDQMKTIFTEMRAVHAWFGEMQAQQEDFYRNMADQSVDVSGKLKHHFEKKLKNIAEYIDAINKVDLHGAG